VRFPPPLVFALTILAGVLVQVYVHRLPIPLERTLRLIHATLALVGALALALSARVQFSRTKQDVRPWTPTPELIIRGPYRFTRNPLYVAMLILQWGVGLLFDNLWIVLFAPLALAIVHVIAVRPEERYLAEKFGEPYEAYRRSVRRYL